MQRWVPRWGAAVLRPYANLLRTEESCLKLALHRQECLRYWARGWTWRSGTGTAMPCPYECVIRERLDGHLQFAFFDLGDGIVAGAGSKRHVGEGGIYARGGDHAGAVWEEMIFGVVGLVVGVEDGGLGIAAHASGAHFVDGESGRRDFRPD